MGPPCGDGYTRQPQLMYVDQHYIHEVTSPQAFQGLKDNGRKVRRPDLTYGTFDHNVPTVDIFDIRDAIPRLRWISWLKMSLNLALIAAHGSENRALFT